MSNSNCLTFLDGYAKHLPEKYQNELTLMKDQYTKKLWHQLTSKVLTLLTDEEFQNNDLEEFYLKFICEFDHRIDHLSLCKMLIIICEKVFARDSAVAFDYALKTQKKVTSSLEATMMATLLLANLNLKQNNMNEARKLLEEVEHKLLDREGVSIIHQYYYELNCSYLSTQSDYAAYYRDALRYLGCVDISKMKVAEKHKWAKHLALSSLLGEDVYNFGELVLSGIMSVLKGTDDAYLIRLVEIYNHGLLKEFESMASLWKANDKLASAEIFLRQKITLLCLMEMVFLRPPSRRSFTFREIAENTNVPENEVELLIIHALSKDLVKGRIDEVDKTVNFTWLKPRVLDMSQISSMRARFNELSITSTNTTKEAQDQMQLPWGITV